MRAADDLIDHILDGSRIASGKRRREIRRELRAHIEDFMFAAREAGRDPDEIEKLVLASFGDPVPIAQGFAWVYRHEWRRLRVYTYTLSTVLLASCLLAAILAMQAGVAFSFGTPIMKVIASRHTAIEAMDILASVAVYLGLTSLENLFEKRAFQKAAFLVAVMLGILISSCAAAGWHTAFLVYGLVNGVFFRAVQRFVQPKAARAGIVLICFSLAGLVSGLERPQASQVALITTCASWLLMGAGYQIMTQLAARLDAALLNGLRRMQA